MSLLSSNDGPSRYRPLFVFLLLTLGVGALGSVATEPSIPTWYAGLAKPGFTPPDWLFAPVWTALYILMAVAAWLVWRVAGTKSFEMALFGLQLAFNCLWSFLFFYAHRVGAALLEIGVLWLLILGTLVLFWRRDRWGGILLLPYLGWTGFAAQTDDGEGCGGDHVIARIHAIAAKVADRRSDVDRPRIPAFRRIEQGNVAGPCREPDCRTVAADGIDATSIVGREIAGMATGT